jgi:hypothetical protein
MRLTSSLEKRPSREVSALKLIASHVSNKRSLPHDQIRHIAIAERRRRWLIAIALTPRRAKFLIQSQSEGDSHKVDIDLQMLLHNNHTDRNKH